MVERRYFISLRMAVKTVGSYEPGYVLPYFEEYITPAEYEEIVDFLTWLNNTQKTFGNNLPHVFEQYLIAKDKLIPKQFNETQKRAFIDIQNTLARHKLTNLEVAEMFTLPDKQDVFTLFMFQTGRWMAEFNLKEEEVKP